MLALLLAVPLLASASSSSPTQDADQEAQAVAEAVAALEAAFDSGDAEARAGAIRNARSFVHPDVIEVVAQGLRDPDRDVQQAAIQALRYMDDPASVEQLQRAAKKDKRLRKDTELYAELLRALGQHADPGSIEILADKPFTIEDRGVIQARIYGLGRIRDTRSVRALFEMMNKAGPRKVDPYMREFRLALMVLTGSDQGVSQDAWMDWWNDNKKRLEVSPTAPKLPRDEQIQWSRYWGLEIDYDRGRRREERGE